MTYQGQVKQKGAYLTAQAGSNLNHWISCFWQLTIDQGNFIYRSVPDNCVDWIFNVNDQEESFFVSPFTSPLEFPLQGPASYFGIRFKILGYQGLIDSPIGEWRNEDNNVNAKQLVNCHLLDQFHETNYNANSFSERCNLVSSVLLRELKYPTIDRRLAQFIQHIPNEGSTELGSINLNSSKLGISSRQLRRLSHLYLGLSLKDYLKVTRFQRILHLINTSSNDQFWLDYYYDQSHYIREFKSFTGVTPKTFMNMSVLYNKKAY